MSRKFHFFYLFRKYPAFRALFFIILIAVIVVCSFFVGKKLQKNPVIESLNPSVGSPGDIMVLNGNNFGNTRDSSYVEIGGSRVTSSSYLLWTDTKIKIILPANVQDGLVFVYTDAGQSKPDFFANKAAIPIQVPPNPKTTLPVITAISADSGTPGSLIEISGNNFGSVRGDSCVYFTAIRDNSTPSELESASLNGIPDSYIAANSANYDYEYWSDNEIRVRIPNGAASGSLYIHTEKGNSSTYKIAVDMNCGTKSYENRKTYLISLSADISNVNAAEDSVLTLHIPRPHESASQPFVKLTESTPSPTIANYRNTIIQQIQLSTLGTTKAKFEHSFVITVYSVATNIKASRIKPYSDKNRMLYTAFTSSDECVPSANSEVKELCTKIIQREKNPYIQAKLIYDYMLDNYTLLPNIRTGKISVLDLIKNKKGDAYDFAIIYTALLRAAGIPAQPLSGVLVQSSLATRNHWWSEFYLEDFGWVPVDPSLGAGLNYKPFQPEDNPREYYFGNLDSQHITFSFGWNAIKPSLQNSKILYKPRTYALQSIWEETSSSTKGYSSLWTNPVVLGVY